MLLLVLVLLLAGVLVRTAVAEGEEPDARREKAAAAEAAGRHAEAAALYLAMLACDPPPRVAALGLARCALALEDAARLEQAENALVRQRTSTPEDLDLRLALGRVMLARVAGATTEGLAGALRERARAHLAEVARARPDDETAVLALARAHDACGAPDDAVAVLDDWLVSHPKRAARASYTKGLVLYEQGVATHRAKGGAYPLPPEIRRLFLRAQGAFLSASAAAPDDAQAWIHVAWASQRLGDRENALLGYERAMGLSPEDPLPLRGLLALFHHDPEGLARTLERLTRERPEVRKLLVLQAWHLIDAKRLADARRLLETYRRARPEDADAIHLLGQIAAREKRAEDAVRLYWEALAADGAHLLAAEEIDRRIRSAGMQRSKTSLAAAREVEAEYARLLEAAPANPYVRNNLAFLLREAWKAHAEDPAWLPILEASAEAYEDAVRAIGPHTPARGRSIPWKTRYGYAQIVNDTAVVFHIFDPIRDLARAEDRYREAMRWSEWGYLDAWTYLRKIYEEQTRWKDLHALAEACAGGLRDEKGEPLDVHRKRAREVARRLRAEGKAP